MIDVQHYLYGMVDATQREELMDATAVAPSKCVCSKRLQNVKSLGTKEKSPNLLLLTTNSCRERFMWYVFDVRIMVIRIPRTSADWHGNLAEE